MTDTKALPISMIPKFHYIECKGYPLYKKPIKGDPISIPEIFKSFWEGFLSLQRVGLFVSSFTSPTFLSAFRNDGFWWFNLDHGPRKFTCLDVFMVNNLGCWWPKTSFFNVFGGSKWKFYMKYGFCFQKKSPPVLGGSSQDGRKWLMFMVNKVP